MIQENLSQRSNYPYEWHSTRTGLVADGVACPVITADCNSVEVNGRSIVVLTTNSSSPAHAILSMDALNFIGIEGVF
jgi:hypothetical protein